MAVYRQRSARSLGMRLECLPYTIDFWAACDNLMVAYIAKKADDFSSEVVFQVFQNGQVKIRWLVMGVVMNLFSNIHTSIMSSQRRGTLSTSDTLRTWTFNLDFPLFSGAYYFQQTPVRFNDQNHSWSLNTCSLTPKNGFTSGSSTVDVDTL